MNISFVFANPLRDNPPEIQLLHNRSAFKYVRVEEKHSIFAELETSHLFEQLALDMRSVSACVRVVQSISIKY